MFVPTNVTSIVCVTIDCELRYNQQVGDVCMKAMQSANRGDYEVKGISYQLRPNYYNFVREPPSLT